MEIIVRAKGFKLTEGLQEHVGRKVNFTLSKFATAVRKVQIHLGDENGPKGGADDKTAKVSVNGSSFKPIHVEERHADLYAAVDLALARAGRALARALTVASAFRRGRNR